MLLIIHSLSIMGYGIMEGGHELLHSFKNNVHFHDHEHHHHMEDHHIVVRDNVSDTHNEDSTSPIHSYFLFFELLDPISIDINMKLPYPTEVIIQFSSLSSIPFVPPPLP